MLRTPRSKLTFKSPKLGRRTLYQMPHRRNLLQKTRSVSSQSTKAQLLYFSFFFIIFFLFPHDGEWNHCPRAPGGELPLLANKISGRNLSFSSLKTPHCRSLPLLELQGEASNTPHAIFKLFLCFFLLFFPEHIYILFFSSITNINIEPFFQISKHEVKIKVVFN